MEQCTLSNFSIRLCFVQDSFNWFQLIFYYVHLVDIILGNLITLRGWDRVFPNPRVKHHKPNLHSLYLYLFGDTMFCFVSQGMLVEQDIKDRT